MSFKYTMALVAALLSAGSPASAEESISRYEKSMLDLPIHVMDTKPTKNMLAIVYSGDGGWSAIDREIGRHLRGEGIPVIGVDSLRYFWSGRSAKETARDLGRIIDYYTTHLKVRHVLLVGYSFGADIMPASYNRLRPEQKSRVLQISLLALSHKVDYVISVRGWLGMETEGKGGDPLNDLKSINPAIVQCIHGKDDDEAVACPALRGTGAEVIDMSGGHHFDGKYEKLARHIVAGLTTRLKK